MIKDGKYIYLAFTESCWGNIKYAHWFVTDGTYFIEFGSANLDIYSARVNINTLTREYKLDANNPKQKMNESIRNRA